MLTVSDDAIRPSVEKYIAGTIALEEDETEQMVIDGYFNHHKHYNYVINEDVNGFLCCTEYDEYIVVNFAWFDGGYTNRKKMIKAGIELYKFYTLQEGKPIIYSGKRNFYTNHCEIIDENVWQFVP